jgi:hypothetical protein
MLCFCIGSMKPSSPPCCRRRRQEGSQKRRRVLGELEASCTACAAVSRSWARASWPLTSSSRANAAPAMAAQAGGGREAGSGVGQRSIARFFQTPCHLAIPHLANVHTNTQDKTRCTQPRSAPTLCIPEAQGLRVDVAEQRVHLVHHAEEQQHLAARVGREGRRGGGAAAARHAAQQAGCTPAAPPCRRACAGALLTLLISSRPPSRQVRRASTPLSAQARGLAVCLPPTGAHPLP